MLRLFQRGNGVSREGLAPINATCDLSWSSLWFHLNGSASFPSPFNCQSYDLGSLEGVQLTFTDGSARDHAVFFTATTEASPDAIADGPVMGSAIGRIAPDGSVQWTPILDESGNRLVAKVEGLTFDSSDPNRAWISIDADDPQAPSELCEIKLSGNWG